MGATVNLDGCVTTPVKCQMMSGRLTLILRFLGKGDPGGPKQDIWDTALDKAIQASKHKLVKEIDDLLDEDSGGMHTTQITSFLTLANFLNRNCSTAKPHGNWRE